jgi:hypothetical protein
LVKAFPSARPVESQYRRSDDRRGAKPEKIDQAPLGIFFLAQYLISRLFPIEASTFSTA